MQQGWVKLTEFWVSWTSLLKITKIDILTGPGKKLNVQLSLKLKLRFYQFILVKKKNEEKEKICKYQFKIKMYMYTLIQAKINCLIVYKIQNHCSILCLLNAWPLLSFPVKLIFTIFYANILSRIPKTLSQLGWRYYHWWDSLLEGHKTQVILLEFKSQYPHLLVAWPYASNFNSLLLLHYLYNGNENHM